MDPKTLRAITRRHFFRQSGFGIGGLALSSLVDPRLFAQQRDNPLAARAPHFAPKAKNVIYLFMAGAPSQLELFDDKPKLRELHGQPPPKSLLEGKRFASLKGNETLMGSQRKFERVGQCGMTLSEMLPYHRQIVDE